MKEALLKNKKILQYKVKTESLNRTLFILVKKFALHVRLYKMK